MFSCTLTRWLSFSTSHFSLSCCAFTLNFNYVIIAVVLIVRYRFGLFLQLSANHDVGDSAPHGVGKPAENTSQAIVEIVYVRLAEI